MSILLPLVVLPPASSRHLPGTPLATGPAGSVHAWSGAPSQVETVTVVPLAVAAPGSARHMPVTGLARATGVGPAPGLTLRGTASCHCCTGAPVQVASTTGVPLVAAALGTTRHLPWMRR